MWSIGLFFFFFKQKTAYEMRISDWSSDVCSSDLATTAEVADVVRLCARDGAALVPQGGNSGMVGGATPDESGAQLLLSLRRMNRLRSVDEGARLAVAEAGVILENFHHAALDHGLRFPLTLGGKGSATIGGLVSTNAG